VDVAEVRAPEVVADKTGDSVPGAPEPEPKPDPKPEVEPASPSLGKEESAPEEDQKKPNIFARFSSGLKRSSSRLGEGVSAIFTKRKLDADTLEELEDLLISSDLGTALAMRFGEALSKDRFDKDIDEREVREALASLIADDLHPLQKKLDLSTGPKPQVVLFVGVNGSGKTTTLGKIAAKLNDEGKKVLMVAGDTFRAAAIEQLKVWGERTNTPVIAREIGADAAGLAFDALARAKKEGADVVLMDTAGRLQNKKELMEELRKIVRVIKKQDESAPHHVILVLDATVPKRIIAGRSLYGGRRGNRPCDDQVGWHGQGRRSGGGV
jgi:fused signal recognition particle receptor